MRNVKIKMVNVKHKMENVKMIRTIAMEHIKVVFVVAVMSENAVWQRNLHPNWNLGTSIGTATVGTH